MAKWVYVQCYATQPRYLNEGTDGEVPDNVVPVANPEFPQPAFGKAIVEAGSYEEAIDAGHRLRAAGDPRLADVGCGLMNDHAIEVTEHDPQMCEVEGCPECAEFYRGMEAEYGRPRTRADRDYDLMARALSVIQESEGADEHAELIRELTAATAEDDEMTEQDIEDIRESLEGVRGRLGAIEAAVAELARRIKPVIP